MPGFVAWNLTRGPADPDPQESLRLRRIPFAAAVGEALSGAITDGPSVALLLCLAERARRGDLPGDLLDCCGVAARRGFPLSPRAGEAFVPLVGTKGARRRG